MRLFFIEYRHCALRIFYANMYNVIFFFSLLNKFLVLLVSLSSLNLRFPLFFLWMPQFLISDVLFKVGWLPNSTLLLEKPAFSKVESLQRTLAKASLYSVHNYFTFDNINFIMFFKVSFWCHDDSETYCILRLRDNQELYKQLQGRPRRVNQKKS